MLLCIFQYRHLIILTLSAKYSFNRSSLIDGDVCRAVIIYQQMHAMRNSFVQKTGSRQYPECFPECSDGHVINIDSVTAVRNSNHEKQSRCNLHVPHDVKRCQASALTKITHLSCNGYRNCSFRSNMLSKRCLVDIKYNCINGTKMFYYLSIYRIVLKIIILSVSVGLVLTCDSFVTIVIFY